jgi:glycosyltransferase involved in cell wall biosynthesis
MTKKPKVSVVTITYNHESYIRQTLDSFLMQETDFPFEIVVADDCSTDKTQDIVREYAKAHPGIIKPILRKKNIGAVPNSISSLQAAEGKYIALCEGDDYWTDPKKLQTQVDFLDKHPGYGLCFHPAKVIFQNNEEKSFTHPDVSEKATFTTTGLVQRNFIHTSSVMYRRQKYDKIPENILPLDWYLHLYHAKFGKIGFIEQPMSAYRRHTGGIWWEAYENMDNLLRKHGLKWLALYIEIAKLYQDHPERHKLAEGAVITMFNTLVDVDKKYGEHQLREALAAFPESAELYIDNLREQVKGMDTHSKEQAKIIKHYVDHSQALETEKQQIEAENSKLMTHGLIRLEAAVKRRLRRKKPHARKG